MHWAKPLEIVALAIGCHSGPCPFIVVRNQKIPLRYGRAFGKRHQELMMKFRYMTCIEVAVRDDAAGEISVDKKGNLKIKKYLTDQDMKRRDAGLDSLRNIFAKH